MSFHGEVGARSRNSLHNGRSAGAGSTYTLAIDRRIKRQGEPSADFLDFVAYGKAAEFTEKYLKKGIKVVVTARCQRRSYEKDGKKIYVIEFIIEDQEFAESKRAAEGEPESNDFMQIPDGEQDELPFN